MPHDSQFFYFRSCEFCLVGSNTHVYLHINYTCLWYISLGGIIHRLLRTIMNLHKANDFYQLNKNVYTLKLLKRELIYKKVNILIDMLSPLKRNRSLRVSRDSLTVYREENMGIEKQEESEKS